MSACPTCAARLPAGETICAECGTDVVVTPSAARSVSAATEAGHTAPSARSAPASAAADGVICPDCGEQVRPDRNGWCPACGYPFEGEELPNLHPDAARRERMRSGSFDIAAFVETVREEHAAETKSDEVLADPLEAEFATLQASMEAEERETPEVSPATAADEAPRLRLEAGQEVFFEGAMRAEIILDVDQLLIGRRDPSGAHYPEIDLTHYRHVDPHISRRHARIFREAGRWILLDLCENDATWLNDRAHVLNGERAILEHGDRILISDSVVMTFLSRGD